MEVGLTLETGQFAQLLAEEGRKLNSGHVLILRLLLEDLIVWAMFKVTKLENATYTGAYQVRQ